PYLLGPRPPRWPLSPSPTLFRSDRASYRLNISDSGLSRYDDSGARWIQLGGYQHHGELRGLGVDMIDDFVALLCGDDRAVPGAQDRKSTRLNSSHVKISYAVFRL